MLKEIINNPKDKLICVDLDGTLCYGEYWSKESPEPEPIQNNIDFINNLYLNGAHIIIWTARFPDLYPETHAWLIKNRVRFHGIFMGKNGSDCYIDDKCININDINN